MQAYDDARAGIHIRYPTGWTLSYPQGALVQFSAPNSSAFVSVGSGRLPGNSQTAEQYSDGLIQALKRQLPDFKLVESGATKLAGLPAWKSVFTYAAKDGSLTESMNIFTVTSAASYAVTYTSPAASYASLLDLVQSMIQSFRLTAP